MAPNSFSIKKKAHPSTKSKSSSKVIDYPEGEVTFKKNVHKEKYLACKSKEFIPSPTASEDTLLEVGIKDLVMTPLQEAKLSLLSRFHEVKQYETPTREFVASFEEYDEDTGKGWKFQLGGKMYKISKTELCEFFDFVTDDVEGHDFDIKEKDEFWKEISDMNHFVPLMSPKNIKSGVWKYIHRLVSMTLFARADGARFVQSRDLNAMVTINKGKSVNAYAILTEYFKIWGDPSADNKAIGGGLIVSLLAGYLEINLATTSLGKVGFRPLTIESMINCQMWGKNPSGWIHEPNVPYRISQAIQCRLDREEAARERELRLSNPQTFNRTYNKRKAPTLPTQLQPSAFEEEVRAFMGEVREFMEQKRKTDEDRRIREEMILAAISRLDDRPTTASTSNVLAEHTLLDSALLDEPPADAPPL